MAARVLWVDARAGIAGAVLLGALLDAGADLDVVRRDVAAVLPRAADLSVATVTRGGMAATTLHIATWPDDDPHRSWRDIRRMFERADLSERVRRDAVATFAALAGAESRVHGVPVDDVHLQDVGTWDSIADVVGVCSALADLDVDRLLVSRIALGDGFTPGADGVVPVPVPAVLHLLDGTSHAAAAPPAPAESEIGELATPTGVALAVALADPAPVMPAGQVAAVGLGAGTNDALPWVNIMRVVLLEPSTTGEDADSWSDRERGERGRELVTLEANVDDLDPRVWPSILQSLEAAGALDAWLVPATGRQGRPAHVVATLVDPIDAATVRAALFRTTSAMEVRRTTVTRDSLARARAEVEVGCGGASRVVGVSIGHAEGRIVTATPEFDDVSVLAAEAGVAVADALAAADAAAHTAGLSSGARLPRGDDHDWSNAAGTHRNLGSQSARMTPTPADEDGRCTHGAPSSHRGGRSMGEILDVAFGGAAATLDSRRRPWVLGVAHLTGIPVDQAPFDVDTVRSMLDLASDTVQFPTGPIDFVPGGYERRLGDLYELVTFTSEAAPELELQIGLGAAGFVAVAFTRSDVFDDGVTCPGGVLLTDAESVVADTYILAATSALELGYDGGIDFIFDVIYDRTDPPLTIHALDEDSGEVVPVTSSRAVSAPVYGHVEYSRALTTPRSAHEDIHRLASDLVGLFGRTPQFVEMLPPDSEDYQGDPLKAKARD